MIRIRSDDDAEGLSCERLKEAWAEALCAGQDVTNSVEVMAGGMAKYGCDLDIERERVEFEREKWKAEKASVKQGRSGLKCCEVRSPSSS